MLLLLTLPVVFVVARVYVYLQLYAPSNVLAMRIRVTPPRGRHVALLAVLATATLIAMHLLADAVAAGAPGWLNLIVLVLAWDAIKFALLAQHTMVRRMQALVSRSRGVA